MSNVVRKATAADTAAKVLATLNDVKKRTALNAIAKAIRGNATRILRANAADVKEAEKDVAVVVGEAVTEPDAEVGADTDHDIIGAEEDIPLYMMEYPTIGEGGVL